MDSARDTNTSDPQGERMMRTGLADTKLTSIEPLIQHFCDRMSEEQWMLLKSGTPDAASKIQIAELVLGMIKALTTNVLVAMENMKAHRPEEEVLEGVSEVIAQISSQTLSFSDKMDSIQSKCLSTLITKEVTESITSSLSAASSATASFLELKQRVVNPYRLNAMKSFPSETVPSAKSTVSKMSGSLREEIRQVASRMVTPLMDDLPQEQFKDLLSEINEEAQTLSEDISTVLGAKTSTRLCKNIKLKIRNFFTHCIAKVWRRRMLEQVKEQFEPQTQSAGSNLVESLLESISSQLQMSVYKDGEVTEEKAKSTYFNAAIDDVNTFIEELYCMINHYFKPDTARAKTERISVAMRRDLCSDLRNKVWIFVALMNWWLTTQVTDISEQVTLANREEVPGSKTAPEKTKGQEGGSAHITQETLVYHLIDKVLWRIYQKTHLYPENRHHLHNRLFELICSNVKKEDLTVTVQDWNAIANRIYKDLCRNWGSMHSVVALLNLHNPVVDMCFVSLFKYQLTRPPRKFNFFCFFRKWRSV
ncbi:unnamed protein product [Tetraodon nigroviridis]|uniref:(spotted green pufferfish) hypothetical protein n=1 Tax=Tetraodon nigroviridis TaxID=99883 RepID=Q4T6A8_TETNG|nr:unnamed protein product [Tetraodon nigroviridis]